MSDFRHRAIADMAAGHPAQTLTPMMRKLVADSIDRLALGPADARQRAEDARAYAVEHLEELHVTLEAALEARGIGYHRAHTAAEAVTTVRRLLGDAKRVAKSKSMVTEEIGLTHALRAAGLEILETDIGEYIVDIEGRGPSHLTGPALHLDRRRIRDILASRGADLPDDDPVRLSRHVRDAVRDFFADCDAGITGANAVIASSGRVAVVENEGNVALGGSHPRLHVIVTGIEKVVADEAAALAVIEVLAPAATAQPLTAFTHFFANPDPGQERHIVFVDNGRSTIARSARYRDALRCIRCGACMNACPVYRTTGGLAYGSSYMGPIGAVISPLIWRDGRHADLPFASSLCGRCTEVCPVGIPLHRMLLDLRSDAVRAGEAGTGAERAGWRAWAATFRDRMAAKAALAAGRLAIRHGAGLVRRRLPGRELPPAAPPRDPAMLQPLGAAPVIPPPPPPRQQGVDLAGLFMERAAAVGAKVVVSLEPVEGDVVVDARAGIANTGSVLLTGADAARRRLLSARRLVVRLDPDTIVRDPREVEPHLGTGDALILTGASRTADIEKEIVRGIHGSEDLFVVLAPRA